MADWECRFCKALTSDERDKCWNCARRRDDETGLVAMNAAPKGSTSPKGPPQLATNTGGNKPIDRQVWVVIAIVGGLMFVFGLFRMNSISSQLMRGFGGRDDVGIALLVVGGLLLVGGILSFANSPRPERADSPAPLGNIQPASSVTHAPGAPQISSLDALERLADLKQRGMLTDLEFDSQKKKLLERETF